MDYLISIDIGTTSTKAIAFLPSGEIISQHSVGYEMLHPKHNFSELDPEEIFDAVLDGIKIIQKENEKAGQLQGISFSSAMHSIMCVDENGKPLTNFIIWADNRSADIAEKLKKTELGQKIYEQTGTPIHPMSPLPKLLWLKENEPELFFKTHKFIGIKEYVFHRFFKKYLIDHSIASATGLFDIRKLEWSQSALELIGIDRNQLSEPVSIFHVEKNNIKIDVKSLDIPENTPFVIGGSDGCLANLGAGAVNPGSLAVTIGTSGAVRTCLRSPFIDQKMRTFCYLLTDHIYVLGGAMNNGGIIMEWLSESLFPNKSKTPKEVRTDLQILAQTVPTGSDGLIFLPYLLGERAPIFDADAKGVFFGVQLHHTQAHFVRAVMEGIMMAIYSIGKIIEENGNKVEVIYANGGFAKSGFWVKMLSDMFGKKVVLTETIESSAFGAAIIGWKALGMIEKLEDVEKLISINTFFEPDLEKHAIYMKNFEKFERLYLKLKEEF